MSDSQSGDHIKSKRFNVEHALSMYAYSYVVLPAHGIYDKDFLEFHRQIINTCHIYIIGFAPSVRLNSEKLQNGVLTTNYSVAGVNHDLNWQAPEGAEIVEEGDTVYVKDLSGQMFWPSNEQVLSYLGQATDLEFQVKYIGQAYGKDGSRNALDRLLKHETLQKIVLKGIPEGKQLQVLMVSVQPNNQLLTQFNPRAEETDTSSERIQSGLEKLFNTDEREQIALYEAAMIRYFQPEFNKEFKDSFPSTNLKILRDCYEKDFSGVVAEFFIDELPYKLCSEKVSPKIHHIAYHDLHDDSDRKAFFAI